MRQLKAAPGTRDTTGLSHTQLEAVSSDSGLSLWPLLPGGSSGSILLGSGDGPENVPPVFSFSSGGW